MHPSAPSCPFDFTLVGAGRVGTAVARLLAAAGHRAIAVASRTPAAARRGASVLHAEVARLDALPASDVVLIGASDAAIGEVAAAVAQRARPGTLAWHFAGSLGISVLDPFVDRGGLACALHPVQACPDVDTAVRRLPGSAWGVTTTPGLERWADEVIERDLNGMPVAVREQDRPRWHAAAVMTSNGTAALLAAGESVLRSIGVRSPERVLGPLAAGTVANAREGGGGALTLTGPAVRGEAETVARHLQSLVANRPGADDERDEHHARMYALVTRLIALAATVDGRVAQAGVDEIEEVVQAWR